jgi:hypothetical protein
MYRPNFCSECGKKTLRIHWHLWTSRRFCDACSRRLWKQRLKLPILVTISLLSIGFIAGRAGRPAPPPLIIQRAAIPEPTPRKLAGTDPEEMKNEAVGDDQVYICGARTKKGSPCSRRVQEPIRCWQHKGLPAMLPKEKLVVKGE